MSDQPVTYSQFERAVATLMEQGETRHAELRGELRQAVTEGVRIGILEVTKDDEFVKRFWRRGYDEVTAHGRDDVNRGIGKRVLAVVSGALLTAGIYIAVKAGLIK